MDEELLTISELETNSPNYRLVFIDGPDGLGKNYFGEALKKSILDADPLKKVVIIDSETTKGQEFRQTFPGVRERYDSVRDSQDMTTVACAWNSVTTCLISGIAKTMLDPDTIVLFIKSPITNVGTHRIGTLEHSQSLGLFNICMPGTSILLVLSPHEVTRRVLARGNPSRFDPQTANMSLDQLGRLFVAQELLSQQNPTIQLYTLDVTPNHISGFNPHINADVSRLIDSYRVTFTDNLAQRILFDIANKQH